MSNETSRQLYLNETVVNTSVKGLIEQIAKINQEDDEKEKKVVGYDRKAKPITLTMNTPGGAVYDGIALISAIELSKTPIHTIAIGLVASMGVPIFVSGHKRFTHRLTTFMYHDISYGKVGTLEEQKRKVKVSESLREKTDEIVYERTNLRKEDLEKFNGRIEDWYFSADEAIKLGVADAKLAVHRVKADDIVSGNVVVEEG